MGVTQGLGWWRRLLKRGEMERHLDAELRFHFDGLVADNLRAGMSEPEARRSARLEFGGVEQVKEECRDARGTRWVEDLLRDLRFALRWLRKSPGYSLAVIAILALGIGANTAIFSVLDGVVLAPLPYREPDRLVVVALYNRTLKYATDLSYPDFLDWQRDRRSLEQIAAFTPEGFDITSSATPEHVAGLNVSSSFFSTLGVKLALGHDFSPSEDRYRGEPVVIISHRLWQDQFAGNRAALGKSITMNGVGYTIIGILRPDFRFEDQQTDVYTPIGQGDPMFRNDRTTHNILCIARLKPDVSLAQARADMNTVQEHIDQLNPATERGLGAYVDPLKHFFLGDVGGTLLLLLGAVGLVLLIACANVVNLSLARSAVRTREFAVRLALGASRGQVVRLLVTESVVLSLIGGALGLAVAGWGLKAMLAAAPGSLPRIENIGVNVSVLFFTLGVSMAVGIVFGVLPALKTSGTDLQAGLKEGGRGSAGRHRRAQNVLVVAQIALTLVLLTGGSLLFRTIDNLWAVNPGFDAQNVITFQVGLSPSVIQTPMGTRIAFLQLAQRIREIPGVEAADITNMVPLGQQDNSGPFWVGSRQPASMAEIPRALYYPIGPDFLRTLEIPLLRGRSLAREDNVNSEVVVLIDTLLARTYFPDRDPVGQTITVPHWGAARNIAARIVGVAGHVEHYGLDGSTGEKPEIYYSFYQLPDETVPLFRNQIWFAMRTPLGASAIFPAIKNAVYGASSGQPIYNVHTMQELVSDSMASRRLPMILLSAFAGLALLLACVGLYGVISYSVAHRVQEIGIRMALGARPGTVRDMVLRQGMRLALIGVAIGIGAALGLTRLLTSLLFGVRPRDPLVFVAVPVVLTAVALLACYLPARRATRINPLEALRWE
jgi:predicted permease